MTKIKEQKFGKQPSNVASDESNETNKQYMVNLAEQGLSAKG